MKATDLMIGDWVYYKYSAPEPWQPRQWRIVAFESNFIELSDPETSCKPIPLTPEILEKNGWWQDEIDGTYHNTISVYGRKAPFSILDGVVINYVHQLQHALRLCGLDDIADHFKV